MKEALSRLFLLPAGGFPLLVLAPKSRQIDIVAVRIPGSGPGDIFVLFSGKETRLLSFLLG